LDADKGRHMGMPLAEFTDKAWQGLAKGEDQVHVGFVPPEERFFGIARQRRKACEEMSKKLTAAQ
jgi:hypothetical protein